MAPGSLPGPGAEAAQKGREQAGLLYQPDPNWPVLGQVPTHCSK